MRISVRLQEVRMSGCGKMWTVLVLVWRGRVGRSSRLDSHSLCVLGRTLFGMLNFVDVLLLVVVASGALRFRRAQLLLIHQNRWSLFLLLNFFESASLAFREWARSCGRFWFCVLVSSFQISSDSVSWLRFQFLFLNVALIKISLSPLLVRSVKTTPQKTRFRDVKICKNLGYRLSGRSQRQEHHWRHETQDLHEAQQPNNVCSDLKTLGEHVSVSVVVAVFVVSLCFCCCHTHSLQIAHWFKMFAFASHSIPWSLPCRMHELSVPSDFLDLFINFTFLLFFIFFTNTSSCPSTSLRLSCK